MIRGKRILILGQDGPSTWLIFNAFRLRFDDVAVIIEQTPGIFELVSGKVRRFGLINALGQVLFRALVVPILRSASAGRIEEIITENKLDSSRPPDEVVAHVRSVNDAATIDQIRGLRPDLVVISGTRILSATTLEQIGQPCLNLHTGITSKYRGVHGAYWALAMNDAAACGVTVHEVTAKLDGGPILGRALIRPGTNDNFVTYPFLQLAAGLPLLLEAAELQLGNKERLPLDPVGPARVWSHPTLWQYLSLCVRRRVC